MIFDIFDSDLLIDQEELAFLSLNYLLSLLLPSGK